MNLHCSTQTGYLVPRPPVHGWSKTPTYNTWLSMKKRCLNPKNSGWSNYGGRGITVCDRWLDFRNFLADMGERPEGKTIDRIDNDGNYEPGNCRWATWTEQRANQRARVSTWRQETVYCGGCGGTGESWNPIVGAFAGSCVICQGEGTVLVWRKKVA